MCLSIYIYIKARVARSWESRRALFSCIAMGHGKRYAFKEQRCRVCGRVQWPSYDKVASGRYALPTLSGFCHCGRYLDQVEKRFDLVATGSIDRWHKDPAKNSCWEYCCHHAVVGADERLLNVAPVVMCSNQALCCSTMWSGSADHWTIECVR